MKIPTHWAKGSATGVDQTGRELTVQAWGWSNDSQAAAQQHGAARAQRACERLRRGQRAGERRGSGQRADAYDYLDSPLREEIVRPLTRGAQEVAVVTRNRYGALVLNTASVCFVDVDFPAARARGVVEALWMLFSAARRQARAKAQQEETLQRVRQWSQSHPTRSFRLYRTAAGLRLLFTDRLYDPISAEVGALLAELGSDPLYRRLTTKQQCFRARLTPKPWRCGCEYPPHAYPWQDPADEPAYRRWQGVYEEKAKPFGTCHLLESLGQLGSWDDTVALVVAAHDAVACGNPGQALA